MNVAAHIFCFPTKQRNIRSREACRAERNVGNRQPPTSLVFFFFFLSKTSPHNDFLFAPFRFQFVLIAFLFQGREVYNTFTVSLLFCV